MSASQNGDLTWFKVGPTDLLVEGRITTVQAGHSAVCLTRTDKGYGAISNRCAHQGGPLGDGFLQNGLCGLSLARLGVRSPHGCLSPPDYGDPPVPGVRGRPTRRWRLRRCGRTNP